MNPVEPIAERQNSGESAWMARQLDYARQQAASKGTPLRADEVALRTKLRQTLGESGMDVLIVFGDDNFTYVTGAALPFAPEIPDRRAVVLQSCGRGVGGHLPARLGRGHPAAGLGRGGSTSTTSRAPPPTMPWCARSFTRWRRWGSAAAGPAWTWRGFRCRSSRSCGRHSLNSSLSRPTSNSEGCG